MAVPKAERSHTCPMCGEPSQSARGGLCKACKAWWYHFQMYSAHGLSVYMENFRMRLKRMEGRQTAVFAKRPKERVLRLVASGQFRRRS